ncbi:MAG: hypothetical protein ACRD3E_01660 [Terriglobales bacterium]
MPAFVSLLFVLALLLVGTSLFAGAFLLWLFSEKESYRDPRRIICPENLDYATILVDGAGAARSMLNDRQEFPIADCSRWPRRAGCDEACAPQVPLVADDRTKGEYAPFGLSPRQLRVVHPLRMTPDLFGKVMRQEIDRHVG